MPPSPNHTVLNIDGQNNRFADKAMDEGGRRAVINLTRPADLLDPALVHHHDAVCDFERFLLIVSHEHRSDMNLLVQRAQPAAQLLSHLGIERTERLVQQQDAGLGGQRSGKCDALTLAAGELTRVAVSEPVELHQIEQFQLARGC